MNRKKQSEFLTTFLLIWQIVFWGSQPVLSTEIVKEKSRPDQTKVALADAQDDKLRNTEFDQGNTLFKNHKFSEALKHFEKASKASADNGESGLMVALCYYNLKKYPQALAQYVKIASSAKSITLRNKAQRMGSTLDSYMKGICPGNCLKPSTPGWRKMNVPGKPSRLVWMVYPYLDPAGKGGSEYWSNDHMGEVIEYVNGRPINKGKCPICGGTGRVMLPK